MHPARQKNVSEFTFQSFETKRQSINQDEDAGKGTFYDEEFFFNLGSLEQQFADYQKEHENEDNISTKRSFAPIKKDQLEKIFKYFRKYEPLYFDKTIIKQLTFKFKKGVYIKKYKEGFYFGEVVEISCQDRKPQKIKHGNGIFVYNLFDKNEQKKRIYEGQWQNDKKNGLGFEKFIDGSVYHGNYKDNKPQGRGKFTNHQGQVYEGQWKDGIKQGKGFWQGIRGQTYMGEWRDSKPNGYGIFVNQNGNRYEGQLRNALKHGQGVERFTNGDLYKGFFENDQPHGYGQYYWKNKSYFKGYFSNGLRQGKGLWKKGPGNCDQYEGQYQNDKKWGYGVFTWSNGNVYRGNYEADLRNGYGQMYWKNGNYYKGEWKDGIQNGRGELFVLREGLRVGKFQNNEIVEIQYEQPCSDRQNEQEQIDDKFVDIKKQYKKLLRNPSKVSNITSKSKNSMQFRLKTHKNLSNQKRSSQSIYKKPQEMSFTLPDKNERKKFFSESQNGMRSVPLKNLIKNNSNSRYSSKDYLFKPQTGFRISQKPAISQNIDRNMDGSRTSKFQGTYQRKNRILHSSFYLHKFKKIRQPQKQSQLL